MARKQEISFGVATLEGTLLRGVNALILDRQGYILLATGTTVPSNGTTGFAKGCIFIRTNASGNGFYVNNGTPTSCTFALVSTS